MGLLNPEEQATFHSLQSRLDAGETLTGEESGDFERLALLIEEREAEYLCPANERLSLEAERLAGENDILRRAIARKQAVVRALRQALEEASREQDAIRRELQTLLPDVETSRYASRSS
jgi:hypothetical protein